MGYSCSMAASYVLTAIHAYLGDGNEHSNRFKNGGFWERGKENADGSITGSIFLPCDDPEKRALGYVVKKGSFKIDASGAIKRFPTLPKSEHEKIYRYAKELCTKERNGYHTEYIFRQLENYI